MCLTFTFSFVCCPLVVTAHFLMGSTCKNRTAAWCLHMKEATEWTHICIWDLPTFMMILSNNYNKDIHRSVNNSFRAGYVCFSPIGCLKCRLRLFKYWFFSFPSPFCVFMQRSCRPQTPGTRGMWEGVTDRSLVLGWLLAASADVSVQNCSLTHHIHHLIKTGGS